MPRKRLESPWRPTREQVLAAAGKTVPDVVAPNLKVLFCGINPGLYTAAIGHHFGRPGNRFWPTLFAAGFTPSLFSAFQEARLLPLGYGITNLVMRASGSADELSADEFVGGALGLIAKVKRYRPQVLAVLGVGAYRVAFARPRARLGRQEQTIGDTMLWVLPNPSGLNAHYQREELSERFAELRRSVR